MSQNRRSNNRTRRYEIERTPGERTEIHVHQRNFMEDLARAVREGIIVYFGFQFLVYGAGIALVAGVMAAKSFWAWLTGGE